MKFTSTRTITEEEFWKLVRSLQWKKMLHTPSGRKRSAKAVQNLIVKKREELSDTLTAAQKKRLQTLWRKVHNNLHKAMTSFAKKLSRDYYPLTLGTKDIGNITTQVDDAFILGYDHHWGPGGRKPGVLGEAPYQWSTFIDDTIGFGKGEYNRVLNSFKNWKPPKNKKTVISAKKYTMGSQKISSL